MGARSGITSTRADAAGTAAWAEPATPKGSAVALSADTDDMSSTGNRRADGCRDVATKRESTSSDAASDAADVCARSIDGNEFDGRVLAQAATRSFTAWLSSSVVR